MSIFHTPVTYPIIIPNIANKDFQQIQYCVNVFSIYDTLSCGGSLTIDDSLSLLTAGMLKHHSEKEIDVLKNRIKEYPGFFNIIKDSLFSAFIIPMMPPEILRECSFKKKDQITEKNHTEVLNMTGAETTLPQEQS